MLDNHSLDIISRFKQSVLSKSNESSSTNNDNNYNRGNKLSNSSSTLNSSNSFKSKVVEYDGESYLISTNESLAKQTYKNKRKWSDYYQNQKQDDEPQTKKINGSISKENINDEVNDDESNNDDESESESDDDDEDDLFKNLKLTEILSPLSHPLEIISHPAILKTFNSNTLSKIAQELIDLIEIEQNNLNWLNKLLQVLNGEDWFYLLEDQLGLEKYDHGLIQDQQEEDNNANEEEESSKQKEELNNTNHHELHPEFDENKRITRNSVSSISQNEESIQSNSLQNKSKKLDPFFALPKTLQKYEQFQLNSVNKNEGSIKTEDDGENGKDNESEINELNEIQEDLINYLQVGIQRQHEYIKTLSTIRNGIVKVDRYRQDLYKWGKEMHDKKSN